MISIATTGREEEWTTAGEGERTTTEEGTTGRTSTRRSTIIRTSGGTRETTERTEGRKCLERGRDNWRAVYVQLMPREWKKDDADSSHSRERLLPLSVSLSSFFNKNNPFQARNYCLCRPFGVPYPIGYGIMGQEGQKQESEQIETKIEQRIDPGRHEQQKVNVQSEQTMKLKEIREIVLSELFYANKIKRNGVFL